MKPTFKDLAAHAREMRDDGERSAYWEGYLRGLRRGRDGEKFGTQEEHETWLDLINRDDPRSRDLGEGYRDGLDKLDKISEIHLPTAADVREFAKYHNLTGKELAKLGYLSGSRAVRKYTGGEKPHRMSRALWFTVHARLFLSASVVAEVEEEMEKSMQATASSDRDC